MVQIIVGEKGKGKTKILIDKVNKEVQEIQGSVVYLDKSNKHMYELNNKIRLINVTDYFIDNYHSFLGFLSGIISQDHDLEKVYFDSFLKIANARESDLEVILTKLNHISNEFKLDFIISISVDQEQIPQEYQKDIIVAL